MKVTIIDSRDVPNPESRSVLQALVSRSLKPIEEQILKVDEDKTDSFISSHVIGYGHDSVLENADSVIINLANISMLAAKAIEDTPLFKGTEASTRYIDFEHQPFNLPDSSLEPTKFELQCLDMQRAFYVENYPLLVESFKERFPLKEGDNTSVWEKAIKAKAFDVIRAFLPCGAATTVNWTTDLRHAKSRVQLLKTHPLIEVQNLAIALEAKLMERYPTSFPNNLNTLKDNDLAVQVHLEKYKEEYHEFAEHPDYEHLVSWQNMKYKENNLMVMHHIWDDITDLYPSLMERPKGCPPPRMYSQKFKVYGFIDFGSFRDIQRHRNGICKIPTVKTDYGFERWYLDQLPPEIFSKAEKHLAAHLDIMLEMQKDKPLTEYEQQYYIPMGYKVPFLLDYDLSQMIYFSELRSSKHVHPTARRIALHVADFMDEHLPAVKLYIDRSEDDFSINRGRHDIVLKVNG